MKKKRRIFLKGIIAFCAAGTTILTSARAFAAWPKTAFEAKDETEVLKSLYGELEVVSSNDIKLSVAKVAENGSSVPITIDTDIQDVESISIVVPSNPLPLAGHFEHSKDTVGYVSARVKMAKSGDVVAVVKSKDKLYTAKKSVKVTLGGCGG